MHPAHVHATQEIPTAQQTLNAMTQGLGLLWLCTFATPPHCDQAEMVPAPGWMTSSADVADESSATWPMLGFPLGDEERQKIRTLVNWTRIFKPMEPWALLAFGRCSGIGSVIPCSAVTDILTGHPRDCTRRTSLC